MTTPFDVHPEWQLGSDGLPINPAADKECKTCGGFGVVDVGGQYASILANCPDCIKEERQDDEIERGTTSENP